MNKKSLVLKISILILLVFSSSFVPSFSTPVFAVQTTNNVVNGTIATENSSAIFSTVEDEIPNDIQQQVSKMPAHSKHVTFLNIEKKVHGFSGLYIDDAGKLNVYVADNNTKSFDKSLLVHYIDSATLANGIIVKNSKHSWHKWVQLENIALKLFDNKDLGIAIMGTDDKNQMFRIGFEKLDDSKKYVVNKFLAEHNIPQSMVKLEEVGKVIPLTGDDSTGNYAPVNKNPIIAGAEIGLIESVPAFNSYTPHCTLGLIAKTAGGQTVGVTAGHCQSFADNHWFNKSQQYVQPYSTTPQQNPSQPYPLGRYVGTATSNGTLLYSDTVLFGLTETQNFGKIYTGTSNKAIDGKFNSVAGSPVCYMGSTSGVEQCGSIMYTAQYVQDTGLDSSGHKYLSNQVVTDITTAKGGDSGSPAYAYPNRDPSKPTVLFAGTVWARGGAFDVSLNRTVSGMIYSPIQGIDNDQGTLTIRPSPLTTLNPTIGKIGQLIHISGIGFAVNTQFTITMNGNVISPGAGSTTDSTGYFLTYITVPQSTDGQYNIIVTDDYGNSASSAFTVNSNAGSSSANSSVSPTNGHVSQTVSLSGSGFSANSVVTTKFATNTVSSLTTDNLGSFSTSFPVPSLSNGYYTVQSTDGSGNSATSLFAINSQDTCIPPSSGDWNVTSSCTLSNSATAPANVIIQPNVVLTIPNGLVLTINFGAYHLLVTPGGQVYIQPNGKLSS